MNTKKHEHEPEHDPASPSATRGAAREPDVSGEARRAKPEAKVVEAPAPKAAETEKAFPFTASINEPQTVSLPLPADVVVPKPSITSLSPTECTIGDDDFTLDVTGENFFADSVIFFAGHDEPTSFDGVDTLSTGVKPSLWAEPVVVQCQVKNGPEISNEVEFTFNAPGEAQRSRDAPAARKGRK